MTLPVFQCPKSRVRGFKLGHSVEKEISTNHAIDLPVVGPMFWARHFAVPKMDVFLLLDPIWRFPEMGVPLFIIHL